ILDENTEIDRGNVELVVDSKNNESYWKVPKGNDKYEKVPLRGFITFDNVTFGYTPGQKVLKNINLYAKPGQKIAFVGSTGAGKTTITNLINRFYEIDSGSILYDGIDIKNIKKHDLRSTMGVVLQDVNLFEGTIAENIRYGRLDATDEEIVEAAKLANAHYFITNLAKGYDSMLTADGQNLSQGERQLISIARAAIADPTILILDEATSSVDTRTERLIEEGMNKLMEGRTTFVIAHRLSTVRNSNAIMVLEHGEILERGDHDDLMKQRGRYYDLNIGTMDLE
ncbi:MAG: ATP-binding cassette domain-containing protein, partial [Alkaliphilus sp.]|nr:ATP-binding cassette domain-containing protein [Alkaliphilus sp.]